jgi:hypothetical protein
VNKSAKVAIMESFSADARIVPAYSVVKARQDVGFYIEAIIRYVETGKLRIVQRGNRPIRC